ncbi:hypothetical protein BJX61DRAFT_535231 [Aspergillus egyptiacus]|nr:hypothetical protein BJX61DRAFT_535231 [Aspergillus egyptiacus]
MASIKVNELLAPNLAGQALTMQTRESFAGWLVSHFPLMYGSIVDRVNVNWMDFLRSLQPSTFPPALSWAIRALVTFHMATLQGNEHAVYCARHMYGQGLSSLRQLLQSPRALTDESLAACVLLGGYEVVDGNSQYSWIRHTRGIRQIMCARGPSAHTTGFGRTLVLCFGPFLIAESFILGEPCFLGRPEWTGLLDEIYPDQKEGQLSLGQAMDEAFNEAAMCPGYYAITRSVLAAEAEPGILKLQGSLLAQIARSREHLIDLRTIFKDVLKNEASAAVPPEPASTVDTKRLAQQTLGGISAAMALLDQLTRLLQSDRQRKLNYPKGMNVPDPWRVYPQRLSLERPEYPDLNPGISDNGLQVIGDRLDRFSLGLGVASASGTLPTRVAELEDSA